ncbi:hypothetical protein G6F24_015448 [Rhizopus arrhizus]|nr:hypothetical protein G6F24_015448 [Rhizopus arrhizus]
MNRQQARRDLTATLHRHVGQAHLLDAFGQLIKVAVEGGQRVTLLLHVERQRRAPHMLALARIEVAEEFTETGDQVGLGEQHVHRREYFQALGDFLHALAQVLGQFDGELRLAAGQLGQAGGDDHAIDRCTRAVLLQQAEEGQPLQPVLDADRVTAGGVEHDAVGGEVPVAVTGPN